MSAASAVWLGILTSISPCPLATNVVAISYIAKGIEQPRRVLLTGMLYTAGRMLAYVVLAAVLVSSLLSLPDVAYWLQTRMNQIIGPILVLTGILLLDLVPLRLPQWGGRISQRLREKADAWGSGGAVLLGVLFALSFCPVSAAIFFGSLIPLSTQAGSTFTLPLLYGAGTALPVFGFAILVAFGARTLGNVFQKVTSWEIWARRITALVFVAVGIYFIANYTLEILN
ncbi:MAG: sulfite exporter TauE/SafE family protein [Bryobacterales bacterium]|nr:sulfite exporter TauE/SafE family protein [Bryobacterales bacterium]